MYQYSTVLRIRSLNMLHMHLYFVCRHKTIVGKAFIRWFLFLPDKIEPSQQAHTLQTEHTRIVYLSSM